MSSAINNIKKSGRGRPATESTPVMVRLQADQLAALDDWRRAQPDLPGRPEAIRRLLAEKLPPR
jgi:hypothetical protein